MSRYSGWDKSLSIIENSMERNETIEFKIWAMACLSRLDFDNASKATPHTSVCTHTQTDRTGTLFSFAGVLARSLFASSLCVAFFNSFVSLFASLHFIYFVIFINCIKIGEYLGHDQGKREGMA